MGSVQLFEVSHPKWLLGRDNSPSFQTQAKSAPPAASALKKEPFVFQWPGLVERKVVLCDEACEEKVERDLWEVEGVDPVKVDSAQNKVVVTGKVKRRHPEDCLRKVKRRHPEDCLRKVERRHPRSEYRPGKDDAKKDDGKRDIVKKNDGARKQSNPPPNKDEKNDHRKDAGDGGGGDDGGDDGGRLGEAEV